MTEPLSSELVRVIDRSFIVNAGELHVLREWVHEKQTLRLNADWRDLHPPFSVERLSREIAAAARNDLFLSVICCCCLLAELVLAAESGGASFSHALESFPEDRGYTYKHSNVAKALIHLRNALFHPSDFNADAKFDNLSRLCAWMKENSHGRLADKLMRKAPSSSSTPVTIRPYDAFADHDLAVFAVTALDYVIRPLLPERTGAPILKMKRLE